MPKVRRNVIANYAGNGWTALMSLAFIPLYIKLMGVESYGLVGFYTTLLSVFALLDLGISTTVQWHLARLSAEPEKAHEARNLVRTLELVYWGIALLIGAIMYLLAPWIANSYLQAEELSPEILENALTLIGLSIAVRWPFSFYSGGLIGLQKQELYNLVRAVIETLRGGGAVLILWLVSPTVHAFFAWQTIISLVGTVALGYTLWRSLPPAATKAQFEFSVLRNLWRFSAAVSAHTILVVAVTQIDKLMLSKLVTLELFAYYSLASTVASALYNLITPVATALYPRFIELVTLREEDRLSQIYHQGCQVMSALIAPTAIVLAFFSAEVLLLWTQNPLLVENAHLITSLLVLAKALESLQFLPGSLQTAHGMAWIKFGIYLSLVSLLALVPAIYFAAINYGLIGAAATMLVLHAIMTPVLIHVQHRRLLVGEKLRWYVEDVFMPFAAAMVAAMALRWALHSHDGHLAQPILFIYLGGTSVITLMAAAMATPCVRRHAFDFLKLRLKRAN
ncbi:MAG: oligosaccharide flippase family protein [Burkholderiales bacterium]|nr:oligosaccharide flippase family protein [Burkholderiales bacterium]